MILDQFIIISYFLLTYFFASKYFVTKENFRHYFYPVKHYSLFSLIATFFATAVGGASFFVVAEKFFDMGIKFFLLLLGNIISYFLISLFVIPKMQRWIGELTPAEIIADIYSKKLKKLCGVCSVLVSIGFVAVQIHAFGYVISYFYKIPAFISIISVGIFTVLYTARGGIGAVVRTDIFQFCMIFTTLFFLVKIGLNEVGGREIFLAKLPRSKLLIDQFSMKDLNLFLNFALIGFNPSFIQRVFISKDVVQAKQASLYYSVLVIVFLFFIGICGLIAHIKAPGLDPRMTIPYLVDAVIPIGIKGIVIAGILSAVMSTADSDLNIASISAYRDVFGYKITSKGLSRIRNISLLLGVGAIALALLFKNIIDILFFVLNFWSLSFMFPLILGILGLRVGYKTVLVAIVCGSISALVWDYMFTESTDINGTVIGSGINVLCLVGTYYYKRLRESYAISRSV